MKTEYLSSDILEENHLRSFYPFRIVQMVLGSCRVDAKNRFVTAPTKAQKLYSILCLLLCLASYIAIVLNYLPRYLDYSNIYYLNLTTLSFHYATCAANVIHVRFLNNDANVKFYIKTQEIDRKLKIDKNKYISDLLFRMNIFTVAIILLAFLALFGIAITNDVMSFLTFGGMLYSQITCTFEWLCCSNLIMYFYFRLRYINAIITNHLENPADVKAPSFKKYIYPSTNVMRYLASGIHDFKFSETDVYLKDISEELSRFQNLYRFQIFLFCFKFVTTTLMSFEFGLLALQNNILNWIDYMVLPFIITIDLIIIIVICIRCEAFARELKETKYLCITILSQYYGGPLRKKAIKMLKMIKEKPPQFSVYDMWHMDASTMISMINLVTTLIVTLLQFALL